jgi:PST family polysaccharide transporter
MMARDLDFKRRTGVALTGAVIRAGLSIALAKAGFGAWAIVLGLLVGQTGACAVSWWLVRFKPNLHLDFAVGRQMLRYGIPVMAMAFLGTLITNVDYLVVGNRLGEGDLGLYQIGFRVPELVLGGVYVLFSTVAFPAYSNARVEGVMKLRSGMLRALGLLSLFGFTAGVGIALCARDMVGLFVGPGFSGAAAPMALIALTAGVSSVNFASGDIFPAVGKPGLLLKLNVANLALTITALVIASNYGIVWVAFVSLPVHGVYSACRVLFANRFVKATIRDDLRAIAPALIAMSGVLLFALPVRLLAPAGAATLVAIVVAGVFGATLALWLGSRSTFGEIFELVRKLKPSRTEAAPAPAPVTVDVG